MARIIQIVVIAKNIFVKVRVRAYQLHALETLTVSLSAASWDSYGYQLPRAM